MTVQRNTQVCYQLTRLLILFISHPQAQTLNTQFLDLTVTNCREAAKLFLQVD